MAPEPERERVAPYADRDLDPHMGLSRVRHHPPRRTTSTNSSPRRWHRDHYATGQRSQWFTAVSDALAWNWWWYHSRPARLKDGRWVTATQGTGSRGFPDGGAVRDDRVLFLELKAEKGRVSPEQTNWIARLNLPARRPTSSGCPAMGNVHRVDGPPSRADDSHNQLNGRDVRRVR